MVRVDPDYNIWTTDIGSHVVLKLSPEGRVTARRWGEYGFREIVYLHLPNFYDVVCERPGHFLEPVRHTIRHNDDIPFGDLSLKLAA